MKMRMMVAGVMMGAVVGAAGGVAGAQTARVEKEVKGLSAEEYAERQAAVKQLEGLIAEQVRQRAVVQEVLDALRKDLGQQLTALGMVSDEEAQAQVAGLLETERGLAGWTIQVMNEAPARRKALLAWGLGKEGAAVVAKAYGHERKVRMAGIQALAKLEGVEGAGWTLGRLVNDGDVAVRAAAMAAAWEMGEKAPADVVAALWHRAIAGPALLAEREEGNGEAVGVREQLKVEFPGGEPLQFEPTEDDQAFTDALLAADVLVGLKSPLVEERVKRLVAQQAKAGKTLALQSDPDWTLATHRLVEAYKVKEAIPMLAEEALARDSGGDMSGEVNGRPYNWSPRTMAAGVVAELAGKDPGEFKLFRVKEQSDLRGWTWGTDQPAQPQGGGAVVEEGRGDLAVVKAFYGWWKEHYKEYGVRVAPSSAALPRERGKGRGRVPQALPAATEAATQPGEDG